MTPQERDTIAQSITQQLEYLHQEVDALEAQIRPVATQCSKTDPQRAELMQNQELLYKQYSLAKNRYNQLMKIQHHIDDQDYGDCEVCDEPIAMARLLLLPESKRCVMCAQES